MPTHDDDPSRTMIRQDARARFEGRRQLLDDVAALPARARAMLPVDDELRDAIEKLAEMKADSARRRINRHYARRATEDVWPRLEEALERLRDLDPETLVTPDEAAARAWSARLIEEGDAALSEFIAAHPQVDRSRLRQIVRNATRRTGAAAQRAREALDALIQQTQRDADR